MQVRGPACLVLELTPAMISCRGYLMPFRRLAGVTWGGWAFTTRRVPGLILLE